MAAGAIPLLACAYVLYPIMLRLTAGVGWKLSFLLDLPASIVFRSLEGRTATM